MRQHMPNGLLGGLGNMAMGQQPPQQQPAPPMSLPGAVPQGGAPQPQPPQMPPMGGQQQQEFPGAIPALLSLFGIGHGSNPQT